MRYGKIAKGTVKILYVVFSLTNLEIIKTVILIGFYQICFGGWGGGVGIVIRL